MTWRDWLPATQGDLKNLWSYVLGQTEQVTRIGERMTTAENEAYARAAQLVGLIKAEFASLRQQLADNETALNADSQADADRLNSLLDELASEVPADVPDVPVPDPGQPAELPADGSDPNA